MNFSTAIHDGRRYILTLAFALIAGLSSQTHAQNKADKNTSTTAAKTFLILKCEINGQPDKYYGWPREKMETWINGKWVLITNITVYETDTYFKTVFSRQMGGDEVDDIATIDRADGSYRKQQIAKTKDGKVLELDNRSGSCKKIDASELPPNQSPQRKF